MTKVAEQETETQEETVPMITLKELCDEANVKPVAARQRLRSKLGKSLDAGQGSRWVFPLERKAEILEMIKVTDKPAKADADEESDDGDDDE